MISHKRPIPVLTVACVYVLVGVFGFLTNLRAIGHSDFFWIEATEVVAVIAGLFMLRGSNWARWLAIAWMGFHVAITLFTPQKLIVHVLIFLLITWVLLRSEARQYFNER